MQHVKYVLVIILAAMVFTAHCSRSEDNKQFDNSKWIQVSNNASLGFTTALKQDGTLWGWGVNEGGFFGLGPDGPFFLSYPMRINNDTDWIKVSGKYIIKSNGTLWAWNIKGFYQINQNTDWIDISDSCRHVMALKKNGTIWAWGWNSSGELGLGDTTNRFLFSQAGQVGKDNDWAQVVANTMATLAIKTNGTLWGWGEIGNTPTNTPYQIGNAADWAKISCGMNGSNAAIKKDGTLWTWGDSMNGQLGYEEKTNRIVLMPTQVGVDKNWMGVSVGGDYMLAIKSDGSMWSWGGNHVGQLGIGAIDEKPHPMPTRVGKDNDWKSVSVGNLAVKKDGTLWAWGGDNYNGDLGLGKMEKITRPTQVKIMLDPKPRYHKKKDDKKDALEFEALNKAIETNPNNADAYLKRGKFRENKEDLIGAVEDYTMAIKINPNSAEAYYYRGTVSFNKGEGKEFDKAIADYNMAIKLNPNYADAYYRRGIARGNRHDTNGMIEDFEAASKLSPEYKEKLEPIIKKHKEDANK